jgi:hypothetical protein
MKCIFARGPLKCQYALQKPQERKCKLTVKFIHFPLEEQVDDWRGVPIAVKWKDASAFLNEPG